MTDICTIWSGTRGDFGVEGLTLAAGRDLQTSVYLSLFTDRALGVDTVPPDGTGDPRGWWADPEGAPTGSYLWLLRRAKRTPATLALAREYAAAALQWMIEDRVATRIDVQAEWVGESQMSMRVVVVRSEGSTEALDFEWAWKDSDAPQSVVGGSISSGGGAGLPPMCLATENSTFIDEGDSTAGWTASNCTLSAAGGYLRQTKTAGGTSSSMTKPISAFTPSGKDYVIYGKVRCSVGTNHIAAIWILNAGREVSIWLGSSVASSAYTAGAVSIRGTLGVGSPTYYVAGYASGLNFSTTALDFALQYDSTFGRVNLFTRSGTEWVFRARVACDWFDSASISVLMSSVAPAGAWVEIDYLMLCRPNMVVIGDSIAGGRNNFDPNPAYGLSDSSTCWHRYANPFPGLRNTLIVNKGRPSESSTETAARISEAASQSASLVFLHASTNDVSKGVSLETRTTKIQQMVDSISASGARCIILNAIYGTSASPDNTTPPNALRDYMLNWWTNYRSSITGVDLFIDIMQPVSSGGYLSATYAAADGVHPTAAGALNIGQYVAGRINAICAA